jgi:NAD(P)-dependent dehydrogenase (short-subunit alcohol dehydrogenase family)
VIFGKLRRVQQWMFLPSIDAAVSTLDITLWPLGIRVNCVAPGAVEIERTKVESPDYAGTWGALSPLGRVGQVEDFARAVTFLTSEKASFNTVKR